MSYRSRVYRQRNSQTPEATQDKPFFRSNSYDGEPTRTGFFQTKLAINKPGDAYEQEADAAANAVINRSNSKPVIQQKRISSIQRLATPLEDEKAGSGSGTTEERMEEDKMVQSKAIQRAGMDEKMKDDKVQKKEALKEEEKEVQKKPAANSVNSSSGISSRLDQKAGKGQPLPQKTLQEMNTSFGVDFSGVNIHTDNEATEMNKDIHAQAFTHGNDIYFNEGKFDPASASGKHLLAHELTHTIQQGGHKAKGKEKGNIQREEGKKHDLQSPRFAGDERLENAYDGKRHIRFGDNNDSVKKLQQAMIDSGIDMPISTKKTGTPDGIFLEETLNSVKEFQRRSGLKDTDIDGIVGPITMGLFDARFPADPKKPDDKAKLPATKKTVTINITNLHGNNSKASRAIAFANTIYLHQANIEIVLGTTKNLGLTETENVIGPDLMQAMHFFDKVASAEEKELFRINQSASAIAMYFVSEIADEGAPGKPSQDAVAYALTADNAMGIQGFALGKQSSDKTFAHELGHVLLGTGKHHSGDENLLMGIGAPGWTLTADDVKTMRKSPFVK